MSTQKNWTGERLETFITNETMTEHLHRYALAMEFIAGKKVLDIACGEGYGTNLMAKKASHVTGVDIEATIISNAKKKYSKQNIEFITGSIENIPATDNQFDVVVCFETLEHTAEHSKMLAEIKRVLQTDGFLIISTPDKLNYTDNTGYKNPFHIKELYENEFKDLLNSYFTYTYFYRQLFLIGSLLQNETQQSLPIFYTGDYTHVEPAIPMPTMYWLAIASNQKLKPVACSAFQHQKVLSQMVYDEKEALKKTITYRTGNILLSPLKFIKSFFRK